MSWIQVRPRMALKEEGSSIIVNGTSTVTGFAVTGNTTSLSEVIWVPLKPTNILPGFGRLSD